MQERLQESEDSHPRRMYRPHVGRSFYLSGDEAHEALKALRLNFAAHVKLICRFQEREGLLGKRLTVTCQSNC